MSTPSKSRKPKPASTGQRIKAIVRKLPPNLPEDVFWRSCELWVNDNTVKEKWFRKGDMKGPRFSSTSLMSRAYIAFKSPEELATFSTNYDGHLFRDKQGNEYSAIVEFAPSQKLPVSNPKVDPRQGTIEDDEDYKSFLELLERGENPSKEKILGQISTDSSKPESTPLLEALITAKGVNSSHKSGKQKAAHIHPSKTNKTEDDVHFSRAQPIVPSGPVTFLKGENSKKTTPKPSSSPVIPKSSLVSAKEVGAGRGKGKGKAAQSQVPASPRANNVDNERKPVEGAQSSTSGTKAAPGKGEGTPKKSAQNKRKKSDAATEDSLRNAETISTATATPGDGPSSSDATINRESGRGRGRRGGRGRGGPPVVVVPKILTKIISEGTSKTASGAANPSASESSAAQEPGTSIASSPDPGSTPLVSKVAMEDADDNNDEGSQPPISSHPRGDSRGRRPYFRGRGRGRGRGARGGGNPTSSSGAK